MLDTTLAIPKPTVLPFYEQPLVEKITIPVAGGVPLGIQSVSNTQLKIGGAFGSWGEIYDNGRLHSLLEQRMGRLVQPDELIDLASLGFTHRHHVSGLSSQENLEVEIEVGAHFLRKAAYACGWEPGEVDAVILGISAPLSNDHVAQVARKAGISEGALKVGIHKACDGSVGGLQLVLNPELDIFPRLGRNLAQELQGKKVLVGGIEGLSYLIGLSRDLNALQIFGNGAGVIGIIPGESMRFLVGKSHEVYDQAGLLAVAMSYPHSKIKHEHESNIEASQVDDHYIRIAGLMHEPDNGESVEMAGPVGMVKLFVRSGVQVVQDVYAAYQQLLEKTGDKGKEITVAIAHHANLKINLLKEKNLIKEGIRVPMPWLLSEFGNVSAASNMIAFLRQLPQLKSGDRVLIDGFGAGTYYDVLVVELP